MRKKREIEECRITDVSRLSVAAIKLAKHAPAFYGRVRDGNR